MILRYPKPFEAELHLLQESDADALFAIIDRDRNHLREWLPWVDGNTDPIHSLNFIRGSNELHQRNLGFNAAIWDQNEICGIIGYHPIDWANKTVMIGYWIEEKKQGRGLVTVGTQLMVSYAFSILKLNRVEIRCATGNTRSSAIPLRLGFVREGIARDGEWVNDHFVDLIIYSMLAREWR
jgi:ribosomal-protein-serine acetyltransferase